MRKNIRGILLATLFVTSGLAEDASKPLSAGGIVADVARMAQIRDAMVQSLRDRLAKENAVEPARDFVLRLRGGVRVPTRDSRLSTPIEERRKAKDAVFVLARRGGAWLPGRASVDRFGRSEQYVETSELTAKGERVTGTLRLIRQPEPEWLSGAIPKQNNQHLPEDMERGWRTDDGMVREAPLPRVAAYAVAIDIEGQELHGRFEAEDTFGRFAGALSGTVKAAPDEFPPTGTEWTRLEQPASPEECFKSATRLYQQVQALDLMRRYRLPWSHEALRMARLPVPKRLDAAPPARADADATPVFDVVRRMRERCEAAWSGRDQAVVPNYELTNAEMPLARARALELRADGAFELPAGAEHDTTRRFVSEWQVAGPFPLDEGWAFHSPLLPDIVLAPGMGYAVETERLPAHYRPEPGTLIRWTPVTWGKGVLRPPLWGENTGGWPQQTPAGLRCARWFASARIHSAEARTIPAVFDFDYRGKLFVNGELVCVSDSALESLARLSERPAWSDDERTPTWPEGREVGATVSAWRRVCRLRLRRGVNEILVSCENLSRDTWFSLFFGGRVSSPSREVRIHAGWASACADAMRRADVGELDVPHHVDLERPGDAPSGGPTWVVPGTARPAEWCRLGPLPDRSGEALDALRERLLATRLAPGAQVRDGDRTACFEPVPKDAFNKNNWVDMGTAHASPSGRVTYWYVGMRCRYAQTLQPIVQVPSDSQARLWISGRLVSWSDCVSVQPGIYPLLVEVKQAGVVGGAPPWLQKAAGKTKRSRDWLHVWVNRVADPVETTAKHLQRLGDCRRLCQWAIRELPGTPEAEKARLMLAAVGPAESSLADSPAGAGTALSRRPERLFDFRVEKVACEPGADPEFTCRLMVAHPGLAQELPFDMRVRIPSNAPVCRAAVLNMDMGGYGIYWNGGWIEECRRIKCAMIHIDGEFIGKKAMSFAERDGGSLLTEALRAVGKEAGRPELPNLPWIPWGLSGGGAAADEMRECSPERLLGCIPYHGASGYGKHGAFDEPTDAALAVPMLLFVGGNDMGSKEAMLMRFLKERAHGGLAAHVREPGVGHVASGPVAFQGAWIEAIVHARLPTDWDPRAGPPEMRSLAASEGWLGNLVTGEVASAPEYGRDPLRAAWLPTEKVARMWQAVVQGRKDR